MKQQKMPEWLKRINEGLKSGKYHGTKGTNLKVNRLERNGGRWK